jgi:hypothetical protein
MPVKLTALLALIALASPALAHESRVAALRLEVEASRASVRYTVQLPELVELVPDCDTNGDGLLTRAEFDALSPRLAERVEGGLLLEVDGRRQRGRMAGQAFPAARAVALGDPQARVGVVLDYPHARAERLTLRSAVLGDGHTAREVVQLPDGGAVTLEGPADQVSWSAPRSALEQACAFVGQGVVHILIGWDHLAFLLALLVLAPTLRGVALTVTAFTLAHSVTLAATALGWVSPPSALVEAVIALSIAWVAFENLSGLAEGASAHRWWLTFAFGLVHGFGFGGVLLELELGDPVPTLVGFNLGVELGQLAVVALAWPLLAGLRAARPRVYDALAVKGLSVGLVALGLWACVERLA